MRRRCETIHDLVKRNRVGGYRVLRCAFDAGHAGDCRPKAWESVPRHEFERLEGQLRRAG